MSFSFTAQTHTSRTVGDGQTWTKASHRLKPTDMKGPRRREVLKGFSRPLITTVVSDSASQFMSFVKLLFV